MMQAVSITLNTSIIYVSGTVNGESVTFTLAGSGVWTAIANKADDGVYVISITGWDAAGNTSTYSVTLDYGFHVVIDRTQQDVDTANRLKAKRAAGGWNSLTSAEQTLFLAGLKGSYTYTDLNRVGEAVRYLSDLLNVYGYAVTVTAKTDWAIDDLFDPSDLETYITDVKTIKEAFYGTTELPETLLTEFGYEQANNIEKLLLEVDGYINEMIAAFSYCGEIYGGEQS